MNLEYAKKKVKDNLLVNRSFIYKGIRNQVEEFEGMIDKCYSGVFTIKLASGRLVSFSYNDVIIGNLVILT